METWESVAAKKKRKDQSAKVWRLCNIAYERIPAGMQLSRSRVPQLWGLPREILSFQQLPVQAWSVHCAVDSQPASFAASMHRMVQARPGQATRFLCRQALALIPATCLTLRPKRVLVVSIRPQTSTDGFAFCSSLEGACVPIPSTWGTQMLSTRALQDVRQVGGEMHPTLVHFGVTPRTALLLTAISSPGESVWAGFVSAPLCRFH